MTSYTHKLADKGTVCGARVGALKRHFQPRAIVIAENFKVSVGTRNKKDLLMKELITALWMLSEHCQFRTFRQDASRDHLVCGLQNEVIQRKLLAEEELSLDKAFKMAISMKLAASTANGGFTESSKNKT